MASELTELQKQIMIVLCKSTKSMKIKDIALAIQRSPRIVSNALNVLEGGEWVEVRTHNDEPGRPKYAELTAKGRKFCNKLRDELSLLEK